MWMAMEMEAVEREMGARTEKSARMEMEMQRRMKRRILLHNLCSGTYDHFMKKIYMSYLTNTPHLDLEATM
jgi:hypothetical protein